MIHRRLRREFDKKRCKYELDDETSRIAFEYRGQRIIAHLPSDYPFKAPTALFINGVEMTHEYFYQRPPAVMKELRFSGCCYMCQSCLCSDNWSPSLTLHDVVEQMLRYRAAVLQAHYNVYIRESGMLPLPEVTVNQVLDFI
jgi:hypothetical protein